MSEIVQNAHIKLLSDDTTGRITLIYADSKRINVYIPVRQYTYSPSLIYNTKLMKDFIYLIDGHNIPELEQMQGIPNSITTIFIGICKQISRGIPVSSLVDVRGMKLIETYQVYRNTSQDNFGVRNLMSNIATTLLTRVGNELISNGLRNSGIIPDRNSSNLTERKQNELLPARLNSREYNTNINGQYNSDLEHQSNYGNTRNTHTNNNISEINPPLLFSMFMNPSLHNRIHELNRDHANVNTRNMIANIVANGLNADEALQYNVLYRNTLDRNTLDRNTLDDQYRYNTDETASAYFDDSILPNRDRILPNRDSTLPNRDSTLPNRDSTLPNRDSTLPNRFMEIPNTHREVILTEDIGNNLFTHSNNHQFTRPAQTYRDINSTLLSSPTRTTALLDTQYNEEKKNLEEKNYEEKKNHTNVSDPELHVEQLPHMLTNHRDIDDNLIKKYALQIYKLIIERKTKHPDFNNVTRPGLRRIKNYLHNITHLWFSQNEILYFIKELKRLYPTYFHINNEISE